jgi:predicted ATPase
MLTLVEALNFRCLRYVRQRIGPFHVLVGPNASGKTTFLDVIAFLGDLVAEGLEQAVYKRTRSFGDLLWQHSGTSFELAIEAAIPPEKRALLAVQSYDTVRYEVGIGVDPDTREIVIGNEKGWLLVRASENSAQRELFPAPSHPPNTIMSASKPGAKRRSLFSKTPGGNDNYYADAHEKEGRWAPAFKLGPRKSTLGNLPEDEENFPVSAWFKQLLTNGIEKMVLNSLLVRQASPPGQRRGFKSDGSNLPWVISALEEHEPDRLTRWVAHLRTALPDLYNVRTVERADDKHRYLVIEYDGGLEVPSWMASDGTLRLMALTLPAYLRDFEGIYLIEEPENGIHPRAIETMYQSLSSVYGAQILMATHSPVILSVVEADSVLCFAKNSEGATDIVGGREHPALREWQGAENLGALFAGGVLS